MPRKTLSAVAMVIVMATAISSLAAQEEKLSADSKASVSGKVIYHGYFRCPDAPVYLFTLEESKPLRALDEWVYKRVKDPHLTRDDAAMLGAEHIDHIVILVETLPRTAFTKTNRKGVYRFSNLVPGQRYHLVALDVSEDGVRLAMGITPKLREGEELKLDLTDTVPWSERFKIK